MLDFPVEQLQTPPQQPAIVHECVVNLEEVDLSFYDSLGAGLCSGSGSSVRPNRPKTHI